VVRKTILCTYWIFKFLCIKKLQKEIGMQFVGSEPIGAVPKSNINLISYSLTTEWFLITVKSKNYQNSFALNL